MTIAQLTSTRWEVGQLLSAWNEADLSGLAGVERCPKWESQNGKGRKFSNISGIGKSHIGIAWGNSRCRVQTNNSRIMVAMVAVFLLLIPILW